MNAHNENAVTGADNAAFYDTFWQKYGVRATGEEKRRAYAICRATQKFIGRNDLQILDLGCGRGWLAQFLSRWGKVTGIDFSSSGIEFARQHYSPHGHFQVANPNCLRLGVSEDIRFDAVVCSEVIEHVPDNASLVFQIADFLVDDGWCFITTPNGLLWQQFCSVRAFREELQPIENWVTPSALRALLQSAGFRVMLQQGIPSRSFARPGWKTAHNARLLRLVKWFGLEDLYHRILLPGCLYQLCVARKWKG